MSSPSSAFRAYALGVEYASVCTSLNDADATAQLNADHHTDGAEPWQIAGENFFTGEPNGVACHDHPATHRHLLFIR